MTDKIKAFDTKQVRTHWNVDEGNRSSLLVMHKTKSPLR